MVHVPQGSTSGCLITDAESARSLLDSDFVDSGVGDFEFRRLLADSESVIKQVLIAVYLLMKYRGSAVTAKTKKETLSM